MAVYGNSSAIDYHRASCLCDVGAPDLVAAVCVTPDGDDALWLISKAELGEANPRCGNGNQPHERLGLLPRTVRDRIWGDLLRCDRPCRSGRPCRNRVAEPGQGCGWHCHYPKGGP
jgi:hypothetical protein